MKRPWAPRSPGGGGEGAGEEERLERLYLFLKMHNVRETKWRRRRREPFHQRSEESKSTRKT
jgi:hypothetical protein